MPDIGVELDNAIFISRGAANEVKRAPNLLAIDCFITEGKDAD